MGPRGFAHTCTRRNFSGGSIFMDWLGNRISYAYMQLCFRDLYAFELFICFIVCWQKFHGLVWQPYLLCVYVVVFYRFVCIRRNADLAYLYVVEVFLFYMEVCSCVSHGCALLKEVGRYEIWRLCVYHVFVFNCIAYNCFSFQYMYKREAMESIQSTQ